ncbi:AAA family ATPase [Candidatus Poriferisodalis sp.]|uniref:AAA family ATPase n=1 Tax=Candidatus Poriferisodalis sp. TaxID=3101277 RepID=UPI003B5BE75F
MLISNFRRIKGSWGILLDAPIVLIHGANGSGKTSILSAIELGLTGEIRAMHRQDDRYTAHLPHRGSSFATIEVDIAGDDGRAHLPTRTTVGGDEVRGAPTLDPETAQFFAERSYLDQASLGQLLDLYQYTEGNQESALARFVSELLGLDQLDALRSGLHDATDIRRLRNLSDHYADAESEVKQSTAVIEITSGELSRAEGELAEIRERLVAVLASLGLSAALPGSEGDLEEIESLLTEGDQAGALAASE